MTSDTGNTDVGTESSRGISLHRVDSLSDGVFAVGLTLLTFDLVAAAKMEEGETGLIRHLVGHWPTGLAYAVGFVTILVCWLNHRFVFTFVSNVDNGLLWLNGLQLALVAAVPLPTSILAENITTADAHAALLVYGLTFLLMAASFYVITMHVRRRAAALSQPAARQIQGLQFSYGIATLWTILCLIVAWYAMYAALVMWALMFAVFAFPRESATLASRRFSR